MSVRTLRAILIKKNFAVQIVLQAKINKFSFIAALHMKSLHLMISALDGIHSLCCLTSIELKTSDRLLVNQQ